MRKTGCRPLVRGPAYHASAAAIGVVAVLGMGTYACGSSDDTSADDPASIAGGLSKSEVVHVSPLSARLVATGIRGAGAIAQVGQFLTGSPMHDRAAFVAYTQPGRVLHRSRLLVASTSNYGAALARENEAPGSILSIDPEGPVLTVPPAFATNGGQASTEDGRAQIYASNYGAFANGVQNPGAITADEVTASMPTGISLNSGNGRPWLSNAPLGATGAGTITVPDPNGAPLAGAPNPAIGGVFMGDRTNRPGATTAGLGSGTLGTAILTKSPDLTGRAVFAAVGADGSVVQVHVQKGVDALAPAGTVTPVAHVTVEDMESAEPHRVAREGIVFNWVPTSNVFIADPQANRLVVLDLKDDGTMFSSTTRTITSRAFDWPIDIAPATREVSAANFASNTTLGGGSDLYVLNRGNNTIVRMTIGGHVIEVRNIVSDVPGFRANGIAVSDDGRTLWVTATTPDHDGVVLELPSFGAGDVTPGLFAQAASSGSTDITSIGGDLFSRPFTVAQGLGPLFNAQSCVACHASPFAGGMGTSDAQNDVLFGRRKNNGQFDPVNGDGVAVARAHSIAELGVGCGLAASVPQKGNVVSPRSAMTLRGNGLLDTIVLGDALKNMALQPEAIRGRPNLLPDGRWGKFGWKASTPTLVEFMGDAFLNEMGVTNPVRPKDEMSGCGANQNSPEIDAAPLQAIASFLDTLDPPVPTSACLSSAGAAQFAAAGCAGCHTPTLPGRGTQIRLYSDLLLHDMGPGLADGMEQGSAKGNEWRTMPLWRLSERARFLHDGRATTVTDAVAHHGGQALPARHAFEHLSAGAQQSILDFLGCL